MSDLDQKPGGKSDRRKQKRKKKAEQQLSPTPDQAQVASEPVEAVVAPEQAVESVAAPEAAPAEPEERVASFKERMASFVPPADTAPAEVETAHPEPALPAEAAQPAPAPVAAPAASIQAIANVYRDYTKKSLEDAQSFAEKLSTARSFDKAVEAQTEFARKACENFAEGSRKIRELHRELFWQTFRLPTWPLGRAR